MLVNAVLSLLLVGGVLAVVHGHSLIGGVLLGLYVAASRP